MSHRISVAGTRPYSHLPASGHIPLRISPMSVFKKRFKTALPKLPVPPVINRTLSLNKLIYILLLSLAISIAEVAEIISQVPGRAMAPDCLLWSAQDVEFSDTPDHEMLAQNARSYVWFYPLQQESNIRMQLKD